MEVVVFGAGSLGSLIGGLLVREHDVTLVGREPHVSEVRDSGLRVTGVEEFTVHPDATTDGEGLSADLAVVTVKSFDTGTAGRQLSTGSFEAAISLQNGMGNEDLLAEHLACPVLAGSTTHGALLHRPGVVEWTGRGEVALGEWRTSEPSLVECTAMAFDDAGLDPVLVPDMHHQLWLKLSINAAINPVTALARVENGDVLSGILSGIARDATRETARVARAEGVDLADEEALGRAEQVAEVTATNRSSMYQDVASGRRTEVDEINGYVVDRAQEHGIDVPINRTLAGLVRAWESGQGLR